MDNDLITGQWIGRVSGLNEGGIIVEAEVLNSTLRAVVYFYDDDPELPNFFAVLNGNASNEIYSLVRIYPFDKSGREVPFANFGAVYPGVSFDPEIGLKLSFESDVIHIHAKYRKGTSTGIASRRSLGDIGRTSNERAESVTWEKFKHEVSGLPLREHIFRGQGQPWPLKTSFHRTKRSLMNEYVANDIPQLSFAFTTLKPQFMNLTNPVIFYSFLGFLQHHGFPTPLLDWTYSPYIAAYFAALDGNSSETNAKPMRIFLFDWASWSAVFPSIDQLILKDLHFSPMRAFPIENERAVTQQSVFAMTNVDDIEGYLFECERRAARNFLRIFDISHTERDKILDDLEMMGITAASLFPGPEGICRAERRRRFDTYK
jgi:hypothetical protein